MVEVNMMSASMNFVLTVQRGSLTANKTFTVITQGVCLCVSVCMYVHI